MNDAVYDSVALEKLVKEKFALDTEVDAIIASRIDVSPTAKATVFVTDKKQVFCYIEAKSRMLLSDVRKIAARMGVAAGLYIPPHGDRGYFDMIGRDKFRDVFPGRTHISEADIMFYRTLAPYNPALILVDEIKNGEIRQYDSDAAGGWRVAARYPYRRITPES